jgi:TAT (twin-arginine translocation) pathway signal sequence
MAVTAEPNHQTAKGGTHSQEETMSQIPTETHAPTALARRDFLKGTTAVAAMVVSGGAVIHTTEAWGLEAKALSADTARSLVKIARDIFPHDRVADRFYAVAVKGYDDKAATDAKLKSLMERGVADLDKLAKEKHGAPYLAVGWEKDRVNLLRAVQTGPFFKKVRGDLVVSLYNQKDIWPLFGYEGESASKGGYIARGFSDITWL